MPAGGILSARERDSKCPGHLESPPLALRVPLEVSTAFRYPQLTNQIAQITSAISNIMYYMYSLRQALYFLV